MSSDKGKDGNRRLNPQADGSTPSGSEGGAADPTGFGGSAYQASPARSASDASRAQAGYAGAGPGPASAGRAGIRSKPRASLWSEVKAWLRDLFVAAIICIALIVYVAQPFRVEKTSMRPFLNPGDRIIVSKISVLLEPIRRGDIVVLMYPANPGESWIKRVIGLPGEEVRIAEGIVYIDGEPLPESYISAESRLGPKSEFPPRGTAELAEHYPVRMSEFGLVVDRDPVSGRTTVSLRIPDGYYFVLGDNRQHSMDSRDSIMSLRDPGPGLIPDRYIYGKAIFRYWPLSSFGPINSAEYRRSESR